MFPLMLLNLFGGIGSGIWLGIVGEWWAVGVGLASFLISSFFLGIVLMPSLLFAGPAMLLFEKGRTVLAFPLILLSQVYTYAVVGGWCFLVFYFFMSQATYKSFWPLLIWSYGIALGPWMYMASKDRQGGGADASTVTTFFAQIAYVILALVLVFRGGTLAELAMVFFVIMVIGLLLQAGLTIAVAREQNQIRR